MQASELKQSVTIQMVARKHGISLPERSKGKCPLPGCGSSDAFNYTKTGYRCYSCGKSGDIFNLLIDTGKAKDFKEALKIVSSLSTYTNGNYREQLYHRTQAFSNYQHFVGEGKGRIIEYFESRGWINLAQKLENDPISADVGYASDYGLPSNAFDIEKAGMTSQSNKHPMQYFQSCVIFPVRNQQGNVVHLCGRALDDSELRWKLTKGSEYVAGPTHFLWGAHDVHTYPGKTLYLCEGISDCLSIRELNLPAVSTFGINVDLLEHQELFAQYETIISMFDCDKYSLGTPQEGQYKSWSQIVPSLIKLAADADVEIKRILCYIPQASSGVKDVNSWLMDIYYSPINFHTAVTCYTVPLEEMVLNMYKDDFSKHKMLLRLFGCRNSHKYVTKLLDNFDASTEEYLIELGKSFGKLP
jgi:hypothetical protein